MSWPLGGAAVTVVVPNQPSHPNGDKRWRHGKCNVSNVLQRWPTPEWGLISVRSVRRFRVRFLCHSQANSRRACHTFSPRGRWWASNEASSVGTAEQFATVSGTVPPDRALGRAGTPPFETGNGAMPWNRLDELGEVADST
jgi:hypothetical protein